MSLADTSIRLKKKRNLQEKGVVKKEALLCRRWHFQKCPFSASFWQPWQHAYWSGVRFWHERCQVDVTYSCGHFGTQSISERWILYYWPKVRTDTILPRQIFCGRMGLWCISTQPKTLRMEDNYLGYLYSFEKS